MIDVARIVGLEWRDMQDDLKTEWKDKALKRKREFEDEIIACYYHINNGPDLRDYQKETLKEATECFENYKNYKIFGVVG